MELTQQMLLFVYGGVSIIVVILLWIAYITFRTKRIIQKQIENESRQYPQQPRPYYPQQNYPY